MWEGAAVCAGPIAGRRVARTAGRAEAEQVRKLRKAGRSDDVFLVTGARPSRPAQIRSREKVYLFRMGIRTLCIVMAMVVPYTPLRLLFIVAAIVLPWMSVLGANAAPLPQTDQPDYVVPEMRPSLGPGREPGTP